MGLPEREILRILLRVVVLGHARTALEFARVEACEAAVRGKLPDREIHRAVVGLVRDALLLQSAHKRHHLGDVLRRARVVLGALDAEELAILVEEPDHGFRDLVDGLPLLGRALDDLVVDVGEVHHLLHAPAPETEDAAKEILEEERAKVAEVRRVVDRGTTRVQADRAAVSRSKVLDGAREGVVETEVGHGGKLGSFVPLRDSPVRCRRDHPRSVDADPQRAARAQHLLG